MRTGAWTKLWPFWENEMRRIYVKSIPFDRDNVTLALESGVDGGIVDAAHVAGVAGLARCDARDAASMPVISLNAKADEEEAARRLAAGEDVVLARGWEIIPVENLLAHPDPKVSGRVALEAGSLEEARLAAGILERGVSTVVVLPEGMTDLKRIVAELKSAQGSISLEPARIADVRPVGMGHRVCVDTCSMLSRGQGMLTGNSSAFTFLVHAETEHNEYVAARPFRINAGGVHCYALLPGDRTRYLEELKAGDETLIVGADGSSSLAVVGRVKVEARPMLYIEAENAEGQRGGVFLQNAETIRLVRRDGRPVSVVSLREGDEVLCHFDSAGRHFGMRIEEDIKEN